jgi:hypothetical protein
MDFLHYRGPPTQEVPAGEAEAGAGRGRGGRADAAEAMKQQAEAEREKQAYEVQRQARQDAEKTAQTNKQSETNRP